jgi:hypothetical protein
MIIIGSRAMLPQLDLRNEEIKNRFHKADYDVIMSVEEFGGWTSHNENIIKSLLPSKENKYKAVLEVNGNRSVYEIELGFEGTSSKFLLDNKVEVCEPNSSRLSLEYCLLTKKSHLIYPVHFEKNINDYHLLKDILGDFELTPKMQEYFKLRSEEAKNRYNQRTPNLNVTTEDFFSSKLNVPHYFVHDDLHEVMAHFDKPIYTMMQKDSNKAWCEKDMFFQLPLGYQVKCVQEEAYVIALERYIIPQYGENCNDFFTCYKNAVKRVCTTLCSGWFREFAIERYVEVIGNYDWQFVDKLRLAIKEGKIQTIEGKTINDLPKFLRD